MVDTDRIPRNRLPLLLAIVFLSRFFAAIVIWALNGPYGFWSPDTPSYIAPAVSLLHSAFSSNGAPEIVRTPGYPLLLVPAVAVHNLAFVGIFENCLLSAISAWLVWKIISELAPGSKAALYGVLLYCMEPVGFLYSEKLLSELMFATQLLLFVWLTVRFLQSPTFLNLLSSAVVLGLATYTRPVSLFLALWLVPFFLLFPRHLWWIGRSARATVFVLAFAAVLAPWIMRNVAVAGYHGFSGVTDVNLYFYSEAAVKSRLERKSYAEAQRELGFENQEAYFRLHPEQRDWAQGRILQFQGAEARRVISEHPLLYTIIHLRGCVIVLLDPGATEAMKPLHLYPEGGGAIHRVTDQGLVKAAIWLVRLYPMVGIALVLLGGQLLLYYLLALGGLRHLRLDVRVFFILLFAYLILVSGSSSAVARFRMPIMPLLCIAGAVAVAEWKASQGRSNTQARSQAEASI